ncbi:MAG: exodeoxyribonuclease VII large subunit [Clostridia bacterium]|nr:exodeoxyribonuclease VII large subunit [Clostridia bacterium]
MNKEILTVSVSQLNNYIKRVLDANSYLSDIKVTGELSNFKLHSSGHIYASLKDSGGVIKLVMFRSAAQFLKFRPEDGMKVIVRGRISVYEQGGTYQIYAESIEPDGEGSLYAAFEKLKEKLKNLGMFDENLKKPLPRYPEKIGVVTAQGGAALQDILNITKRRYPLAEIVLFPVSVQGVSAAGEISNAINYMNVHNLCDVMIVGRGGGSIEDLWAFNEEIVATAIFNSKIPIVSAVGHETDFTIADFVADLRAPTPSAAAELVCPDAQEMSSFFENAAKTFKSLLINNLEMKKTKLVRITSSYVFTRFSDCLATRRQTVDTLVNNALISINNTINEKKNSLVKNVTKLDALSPLKVLSRGYSLATDTDGNVISSVKSAKSGKEFLIKFSDGDAKGKFI